MSDTEKQGISYKWELIILLWFAFLINMADRQAYNIVLPYLSKDLGLDSVKAGLVASIFLWFYAAMVPLGGYLGDVARRKWIVFGSLMLWSVGTILSGATTGIIGLVIFRSIATGGGEAFYFPSANSLIGQYHQKTRALAMSIHQTALYVGIVASGFVAGWLADEFGWRWAFYVFGGLGAVLALIILWRVKDVAHTSSEIEQAREKRVPLSVLLKAIALKPTVWALWIGFGCFYFALIGYITWMPTFLHENYGLSLKDAGFNSMFYHHLFAAIGVLLGGRISDMLAARRRTVRIETEFVGLLLGVPFIYLMASTNTPWICYASLACFGLFRGVYDSNLYAVLFDVIEPRFRSSAVGLMLSFVFFVGAFAPVALGWAKDTIGLAKGLSTLSLVYAVGALVLFVAWKTTFKRDYYDESAETEPVVG